MALILVIITSVGQNQCRGNFRRLASGNFLLTQDVEQKLENGMTNVITASGWVKRTNQLFWVQLEKAIVNK